MSDELKYMTAQEFRERGYLQELNRLFLHPLGLALALDVDTEGTDLQARIWDCRDDPEGIYFGELDLKPLADAVNAERLRRKRPRKEALGYVIQPRE